MAAALVLLFTFTAGGIIWLGRDVNQTVALRSTAQSIAFQAARAGAQEIAVSRLRADGDTDVSLDRATATSTAMARGNEMIEAYAVEGVIDDVTIDADDNVTVTVRLDGPGDASVTGVGTAHPETQ